ncbi:DUF4652 domain-containing protein [Psychrobacillus sp. OK032]|uniref:DUF4652 domain-containing protein n=1 Tax=Psychrobacillus sp. OK032 TaxID=1884358 RepID=UPI0015A5924D|nr:DUF4652 domain-containing protein [Psychrobacillus sp. OK032]
MNETKQQLKRKIGITTIIAFLGLLIFSIFITPSVLGKDNTPDQFNAKIEKEYEVNFHSGWKKSSNSLQQATIDGKGEFASEEGEAVLVIENLKSNVTTIYRLKDNDLGQYTPKYIEWIDGNRLFVIIGYSYGTVTTGGKLYELNIKENALTPVIEGLPENEEIMSVKVNKNGTFTYKKHIYDSDNYDYSESHIEERRMPIPLTRSYR